MSAEEKRELEISEASLVWKEWVNFSGEPPLLTNRGKSDRTRRNK